MIALLSVVLFSLLSCALSNKEASIAVVGGGWSGLFAAYHLVANGFTYITLFESSSRLGGYTTSLSIDSTQPEQFDATVYASTVAQWKFLSVANRTGITFCPLVSDTVRRVPAPPRTLPTSIALRDIAAASLDDPIQVSTAIRQAIQRYTELWASLMNIPFINSDLRTNRLFPPLPTRSSRRQLAMPAKKWLIRNNLEILEPILRIGGDAQAYGPVETTPILYYFTFITPQVLAAFASGQSASFSICDSSNSYQDVFDAILRPLEDHITIHFDTTVKAVHRRKNDAVEVTTSDGRRRYFDRAILTSKLADDDRIVHVLPSLRKDRRVRRTVTTLRLFVALMKSVSDALLSDAPISYDENALKGVGGSLIRFFGARNGPTFSNGTSLRLGGLYAYRERDFGEPDTLSAQQRIQAIQDDFALWDSAKWRAVFTMSFSAYFQRWTTKNVRRGLPWVLDSIQGRGGVYYLNSASCGFESVGHLFDCAERVISKLSNDTEIEGYEKYYEL